MKNCFKNTEVDRRPTRSRTRCSRSSRAAPTRSCTTTRCCCRSRPPTRPRSSPTTSFLQAPFGIGIKQGNTALKAWVDSRLDLMRKKDQFLPILKANVPAAVPDLVLEEHPAAEQHVLVRDRRRRRASTRCARSSDSLGEAAARAAAAPRSRRCSLATTTSGRSSRDNWDELFHGLRQHAQGLGDRDRRLVRDRARARRRARVPGPGREPAHGRLRRGHPLHADPRADLHASSTALPQIGIMLDPFTVAWLSVTLWGGAFNSENFRAGFDAVSHRHREAALRARLRAAAGRS